MLAIIFINVNSNNYSTIQVLQSRLFRGAELTVFNDRLTWFVYARFDFMKHGFYFNL